jgi:hypothetical protein
MKFGFKILIVLLILSSNGQSQGFANLDFESAIITNSSYGAISANDAFPGWTVNAHLVYYDDISLSGESASIVDTNPPTSFSPIQGKYYAILTSGNYPGTGQPISIGQTGTIPSWAQSIIFWGNIGGMRVTFAGQSLNFLITGNTANYNIYTADISSYTNQNGELLFTMPPYVASATLDNIYFSSFPVPEPSIFALAALGGVLLVWRAKRKLA